MRVKAEYDGRSCFLSKWVLPDAGSPLVLDLLEGQAHFHTDRMILFCFFVVYPLPSTSAMDGDRQSREVIGMFPKASSHLLYIILCRF
jgi:hypothetical protein